jgi:rhamnogalacturonyl hydrolase YesR
MNNDELNAVIFNTENGITDFKIDSLGNWSSDDEGISFKSDNNAWSFATIMPSINDYRMDVDVAIRLKTNSGSDLINPGKWHGAGLIFRKSGDNAALFCLSQPCGGWAAIGRFFPLYESRFPGKDSVYALSKDTESNTHRLTVCVKGDLANCFVDDELACILDLSGYTNGEVGLGAHYGARFTSFRISKLQEETELLKERPVKQLLNNGEIYENQYSWQEAIAHSIKIMDTAIEQGTADVPGQENMPAFTYRCVTWMSPGMKPFYAYPAFHHSIIIDALIKCFNYTKDEKYLNVALNLSDWEIEHSTPATDKLPNLPYSTTYNGEMGGNVDGDTVMLDKAGIMGEMYLKLWRTNSKERYLNGAVKIAETLLDCQLPSGRWQARVEHATGKVVQDYVSNQIFNIRLMDELFVVTGDKRYSESSQTALSWLMDNPIKTWRWTGYYEDVEPGEESIGNWEAIDTARYLLAHREGHPEYLTIASDISDWVATSFTVNESGYWPLVCEQSVCMPAMVGHTLHYALLLVDMYKATRNEYYREAAISAVNASFDLARTGAGVMDWYSIAFCPLYFGLDLVDQLGL